MSKTVSAARGQRIKYPKIDLPLGVYGSTAHWLEIYRDAGRLVVPVTCGVCRRRHRLTAYHALRPGATGLHDGCYRLVISLDGDVPVGRYGSILHPEIHDLIDPRKRAVTCGWCGEDWFAYPQGPEQREAYSWLCPDCVPRNRGLTREHLFPKGTKALYNKRDAGNVYRVAIECRGCFKDTGQLKYVPQSTLYNYIKGIIGVLALVGCVHSEDQVAWCRVWCRVWPRLKGLLFWDELCSDCRRARGGYKFTGWKTAPSETKVFIPEELGGEALILYKECGCERKTNRRNALLNWRKLSELCPFHKRNHRAYAEMLRARASSEAENSNRQESGNSGPVIQLEPQEQNRVRRKTQSKDARGGAHNVKWTPELRAQLLIRYEDLLLKIKENDQTLPQGVRDKIKLRGNKPSDIALDYAASQLNVKSSEYLRRTVLPEARRERDKN